MGLKKILPAILLIVSLYNSYAQAQTNNLRFELFTIDQKLSQNNVFCIMQDKQGFMWFGTQDGLNRYDGYEFKVFRYEPSDPNSLSDGHVVALLEDKNGDFWIGTKTGGLNKFDRKRERFTAYQHIPGEPTSLSGNDITSLYEDSKGTIWVGTENGLNKLIYKDGNFFFQVYKNDPKAPYTLSNNNVRSICEDSRENLWIGTADGLNLFDPKTGIAKIYKHEASDSQSLSKNTVNCIFEDSGKNLWIGTDGGGLNKFNYDKQNFTSYLSDVDNPFALSDNTVSSIKEPSPGLLWIGTRKGGLNEFDTRKNIFTAYKSNPQLSHSLSYNDVTSLWVDRSGTLWIGTLNGGLNKLNRRTKKIDHYETNPGKSRDLGHSFARSIYEDEENILWVATSSSGSSGGGGLKRFDRKTGLMISFVPDPKNPYAISNDGVWSIFAATPERMWLGTIGGLNKFNKKTGKFIRYLNNPNDNNSLSNNYVYSVYEDKKGVVWAGTLGGGLNKMIFDGDRLAKVTIYKHDPNDPESLSHDEVTDIHEDKEGLLWIGTRGGLNRFDTKTQKFKSYKAIHNDLTTLSHNYINSIAEDKEGRLWIPTYGGGLNIFDKKTEKFTRISETDGLPNNVVYGALPDRHGNFWLSTNKGVSCYNPEKKTFKNYFANDGLQSNEFNRKSYYESTNGELFFGGVNGLNAFFPDSLRNNDYKPEIVITDFKIFNKSVALRDTAHNDSPLTESIGFTKKITLSYKYNVFEFEFASLHFDFPEKNQYAYIMENFDDDWNYTGADERFATYTNLPPGNYTFRVKGSNSDGVWNDEGVSIDITVTPPFWRTIPFYLLCSAIFIVSVFLIIRRREVRLRRQQELLEENVRLRTAEVLKQKDELHAQRDEIEAQRNKIGQAFNEIEKKNKDITGSINYAKRIQEAILPLNEEIKAVFPEFFIFFRPRDIVSGDYYWFYELNGKSVFAAIDCTGHGVPGALMSVIGDSILNEIVVMSEVFEADLILNAMHQRVRKILKQEENENRDGMDMTLCILEKNEEGNYALEFAGAQNSIVIMEGEEQKTLSGDKCAIGGSQREALRLFTKHSLKLAKGSMIYMYSDGFADQFGHKEGKKFSARRLKELFQEVHTQHVNHQKEIVEGRFEEWKGESRQIDDIMVIGLRLT